MWTQFGTVGELARSTLYSGARSVVVAQWNVSDASTRALMTAFHRRLKSGTPRDRALQEAMAELRGSAATKHPTNWASFRCLGVGWR
jgi:CHAT domain-containing protein